MAHIIFCLNVNVWEMTQWETMFAVQEQGSEYNPLNPYKNQLWLVAACQCHHIFMQDKVRKMLRTCSPASLAKTTSPKFIERPSEGNNVEPDRAGYWTSSSGLHACMHMSALPYSLTHAQLAH